MVMGIDGYCMSWVGKNAYSHFDSQKIYIMPKRKEKGVCSSLFVCKAET